MNILFTVCCRAGSKSLKDKNLRSFLDTPLVYYTLASIKLYREYFIGTDTLHLCLNTDSENLIKQVLEYEPGIFVIRRDESLAGDSISKVAVIKDCLKRAELKNGLSYDVVVDLDATSPLRRVMDIHAVISKKLEQRDIDVVFSVTPARRNPYFNMVKINPDDTVGKVIESEYTTRQQAPEMFDMNASIYAYGTEFLRCNKTNMVFDGRYDIVIMPDTGILDIDSEDDFVLMEVFGEYIFKNDRNYGEIAQAARFWR